MGGHKRIAILCSADSAQIKTLDQLAVHFGRFQNFYEQLQKAGLHRGFQFYFVSASSYDSSLKQFDEGWTYVDQQWQLEQSIIPDLIYDKISNRLIPELFSILSSISQQYRFVNSLEFTMLVSNKLYTSLLFPEYCQPYQFIVNQEQLRAMASRYPDRIVLKQMRHSSGDDVYIVSGAELQSLQVSYPILLQQFVDSSAGIPGLITGLHDLRVMCINDRIVHSYIRQPATGSLLANIAQGGSVTLLELSQIPDSVLAITSVIQQRLAVFFPAIYTIDFLFDADGRPWIIELNTKPGMQIVRAHV